MKTILRQGDVLLVKVAALPKAVEETTKGDIILAHGEVTGHAHRIKAPAMTAKLWSAGAERFLQAMETVALTHEEHATITIEPGIYRVVIQTEYSPEELRNVAD
jgi:ribosomal protein L18E